MLNYKLRPFHYDLYLTIRFFRHVRPPPRLPLSNKRRVTTKANGPVSSEIYPPIVLGTLGALACPSLQTRAGRETQGASERERERMPRTDKYI